MLGLNDSFLPSLDVTTNGNLLTHHLELGSKISSFFTGSSSETEETSEGTKEQGKKVTN